jgi:membrane protein YqaA with SNARE-associated domain
MRGMTGKAATVWAAVASVVLWVIGLIVLTALPTNLSDDKASDEQILAWVRGNTNDILLGGWLFMIGCIVFIWFAGLVRARLVAAEGDTTLATIGFAGAVATAIFGMANAAGDVDAAISKNDISASTAGTLHHLGDGFFVCAELALIVVLVSTAVVAFRTAVLPRWWAIVSIVIAVVLVIGPIGWAALIFGLPVWTLGTSVLLARTPRTVTHREPAPAV